jgi:hypothetical protein
MSLVERAMSVPIPTRADDAPEMGSQRLFSIKMGDGS